MDKTAITTPSAFKSPFATLDDVGAGAPNAPNRALAHPMTRQTPPQIEIAAPAPSFEITNALTTFPDAHAAPPSAA